MIEERLIALETKLSYQEDTIQELNNVIYEQQQKLDQLEIIYRTLADRTKALTNTSVSRQISDEKPPHY